MELTKMYRETWLWHPELLPHLHDSPFLEQSFVELGSVLSFHCGLVVVLKLLPVLEEDVNMGWCMN
jgi:hypothetical protein